MLCREVLVTQPFQFKHGTRDRGQCWDKIASNLNLIEVPRFLVDQRGVRDRYTKLIKDFKRKRSLEERASGICPDEPDELDQALEELIGMEESQQEQLQVGEKRKRAELDKDRATAESMRKRAMERMGETRARENVESEGRKRRGGTEVMDYLKERRQHDSKLKEEELELRKREMDLKERREEEDIMIRRRQQDMKEREQSIRERELEGRLKRDQDIIFILKQQLQQQQAILEEVQQQNKLLLSLYQNCLEKKE